MNEQENVFSNKRVFREEGLGLVEEHDWVRNPVTSRVLSVLCKHILHRIKEAFGTRTIPEALAQRLSSSMMEKPFLCKSIDNPPSIHEKYIMSICLNKNLAIDSDPIQFHEQEINKSLCKFKYLLKKKTDPTIELLDEYRDFPLGNCFLQVYTFSNHSLMNSILYGAYQEMIEESDLPLIFRGVVEIDTKFYYMMHVLQEDTCVRKQKCSYLKKKLLELSIGYNHTDNTFIHIIDICENGKVIQTIESGIKIIYDAKNDRLVPYFSKKLRYQHKDKKESLYELQGPNNTNQEPIRIQEEIEFYYLLKFYQLFSTFLNRYRCLFYKGLELPDSYSVKDTNKLEDLLIQFSPDMRKGAFTESDDEGEREGEGEEEEEIAVLLKPQQIRKKKKRVSRETVVAGRQQELEKNVIRSTIEQVNSGVNSIIQRDEEEEDGEEEEEEEDDAYFPHYGTILPKNKTCYKRIKRYVQDYNTALFIKIRKGYFLVKHKRDFLHFSVFKKEMKEGKFHCTDERKKRGEAGRHIHFTLQYNKQTNTIDFVGIPNDLTETIQKSMVFYQNLIKYCIEENRQYFQIQTDVHS